MSTTLKSIVEENTTTAGRRFDLFFMALIILSLVSYAVETIPDLPEPVIELLNYAEIAIVTLFTVEYGLRIHVASRKWRFATSFYGLIDLIAILPFYLALVLPALAGTGLDLRMLRMIRLLRLFRAFKVVRYSKAIRLFAAAFQIAKAELVLFFITACMLLYIAAAGIHFFESEAQPQAFSSWFSSLWWAVVTLTTVGYGDVYPITLGGRIFTFFLLLIGIGTIAVPSGIIASALGKARAQQEESK